MKYNLNNSRTSLVVMWSRCCLLHCVPSADGTTTARRPQVLQPGAEEPGAGGGIVGLFVAGWMALLACIMQLLSPVFSLGLFIAQPLTRTNPVRARAKVDKWVSASVTHTHSGCRRQSLDTSSVVNQLACFFWNSAAETDLLACCLQSSLITDGHQTGVYCTTALPDV